MRSRSSIERFTRLQRLRARAAWQPHRDAVVVHYAYGANGKAVVEGRVVDHEGRDPFSASDRKLRNLKRNLQYLFNDERENVPVRVRIATHEWHTLTDAEGYFRVELEQLAALPCGWNRIECAVGETTDSTGLLLVPPDNVHGVITDVDDTLLVTEVGSTRRMLYNTFLRNPLQRQVVPGIRATYCKLAARNPQPQTAPFFYLSATPRQLHLPLQVVLDHNGLPRGVLITKRITNDASSEPLLDQLAYKTAKIEEILQRVPHVRFTLIGDDGERDPEIFAAMRARYPDRIENIWIRRVHADPHRARFLDQLELTDLLHSN